MLGQPGEQFRDTVGDDAERRQRDALGAVTPTYDEYQEKTDRVIPVLVAEPA